MNSKAVFAGTFDPFTLGHYDIAKRASKLFDELTVAVFDGTSKTTMFSIDKRMEIVELSLKELQNVNIVKFDGLLTDLLLKEKTNVIVRGLRSCGDFEFEFNLLQGYRSLLPNVEGCYLMSSENLSYISSSFVREIIMCHGNYTQYLCKGTANILK